MEKICWERKEITGLQFLSALLFLLISVKVSSCDKRLLDASVHPMVRLLRFVNMQSGPVLIFFFSFTWANVWNIVILDSQKWIQTVYGCHLQKWVGLLPKICNQVYNLFASFTSVSVYWLVYKHLCSSCPDVACQLAAPYASWIGSHNITLTWASLNQSDVVYILQWTGPSLSGIWAQAEVLDDFMLIYVDD